MSTIKSTPRFTSGSPTKSTTGQPWLNTSDGPRLRGSVCADCHAYAFPAQPSCQRCAGEQTATVDLSPKGILWTFTVQGFPPNAPPYLGDTDAKTFKPFAVGYVELEGQLKVESRLTESDPAKLRIGMPMQLVIVEIEPPSPDASNQTCPPIQTFAFSPQ